MPRFTDKVVVVTGAASGIGAATARHFSAEGARVIVADINLPAAEDVAAAIAAGGGRAEACHLDASSWGDVEGLLRSVATRHGGLDVLINNAGIGVFGAVPDLAVEDWSRCIAVTLNGAFHGCKAAIPLMRGKGGAIVNVASISGLAGDYGLPAYNAAKGGVINFTRSIAVEHIRDGIRINCVCPGLTDTEGAAPLKEVPGLWARIVDAYPRGTALQPDEIAAVIAFVASDEARALVGSVVVADGGMTAWTGAPGPPQPTAL